MQNIEDDIYIGFSVPDKYVYQYKFWIIEDDHSYLDNDPQCSSDWTYEASAWTDMKLHNFVGFMRDKWKKRIAVFETKKRIAK